MALTKVDSAASSTLLLSPDGYRRGFIIENSDANRLHVLLDDGTASATNYNFSLAQYENARIENYKGTVKGIWASDGSGAALITLLE